VDDVAAEVAELKSRGVVFEEYDIQIVGREGEGLSRSTAAARR
jgi:hypothetical protein